LLRNKHRVEGFTLNSAMGPYSI